MALVGFGLLCPAVPVSHCPPLLPSHAASPGQPGIPPQCHGGCRAGPDLPSRHYGKSHSEIAGQGIVLQGCGHEGTVPREFMGFGHRVPGNGACGPEDPWRGSA